MNTKFFKQIVAGIAFLLLFTLNCNAQDKARHGAKAVTENMKEQLSLNDGQAAKVQQINLDFLQKAIENKESGKSKVEKAKKLKQLDDDRDKKLESVLSKEQFKKFVATKSENRKKMREHFEENK